MSPTLHRLPLRMAVVFLLISLSAAEQLPMIDPVAIGHTIQVELAPGRIAEMRTLAMYPPVFYVSGFLDDAETDAIMNSAIEEGMKDEKQVEFLPFNSTSEAFGEMWNKSDIDGNGALDERELQILLQRKFSMPNHDHAHFLDHFNITSASVSLETFVTKNIDLGVYLKAFLDERPHARPRHLKRVDLHYKLESTNYLRSRAQKFTKMPTPIAINTGFLEVLHYPVNGHHSCQYDSLTDDIFTGLPVRLLSFSMFLNEPEDGGELGLPGADFHDRANWNISNWVDLWQGCQPIGTCNGSTGVFVKPKKGDAIWWYNMEASQWTSKGGKSTARLDAFYPSAFHCSADVGKGAKWVATLWMRSKPGPPRTDEL